MGKIIYKEQIFSYSFLMNQQIPESQENLDDRSHKDNQAVNNNANFIKIRNLFCVKLLTFISYILVIITFPLSLFVSIKIAKEYQRVVVFRLGRLLNGKAKGPGLFFILPCIDSYNYVDLRTISFDVPSQEVLTKDSVAVSVDAVVYYSVSQPTEAICKISNFRQSTELLAATSLRNALGARSLAEILSDRALISSKMQKSLDDATDLWGVQVERVEIKDVRLPDQLQRAMAAEAEATREAKAKVIAAEGERNASKALKEAAKVISDAPVALQLRYLQTLNVIAAENNSTIIFPLPIDFFRLNLEEIKKK